MSVALPNGAIISIASALAAAVANTAISNANPANVTAANTYADGDIVVVDVSGWTKLQGRAIRVAGASATEFDLEGFSTLNEKKFIPGAGIGSTRKVTDWVQISQILESTFNGGEGQFFTYGFLEDDEDQQIPTTKTPQSLTLRMADDQNLPWYDELKLADEDRLPRAIRIELPSGAVLYYNAYVSFTASPTLTRNELMANNCTLSFLGSPMRYAS